MIKIGNLGTYESVPQTIRDIIEQDFSALEKNFAEGCKIDEEIKLSKYISISPLNCALIMNRGDSLKWLVEKGANLNVKNNSSFLIAVRYCDEATIRYLVENGAKINGVNNVKSEAFSQALYGNRVENLPIIHQLGHTVEKYGGCAFRSAVSDRNYPALQFFIKHGIDINYNKPDMVYPFKPTPLCVAARYVDLEMCKFLVTHGADVTMGEANGMRPYSIAIEKDDEEMAIYFKNLEPVEFHNTHNKLDELKPYKLSKDLVDFLQSKDRHIDLENCDFGFVDFFHLTDTVPFKHNRQKLLRISQKTGDYSHIILVWNPKSKKVGYYDEEHKELGDLGRFEEFIANPSTLLNQMF